MQVKSLEERKRESDLMLKKYPGRCCIYVEKRETCKTIENLSKQKFLIPQDIQIDQFICMIRNRLELDKGEGLFFYVKNNKLINGSKPVGDLYKKYKSSDNFLYITYTSENCFG